MGTMIVVWGQRLFGRVDRFAGSHVATRFFHVYYLPLIPLSSWLVLEEKADGEFLGLQVPLQLRSVLSAWLRLVSVVTVLVAGYHAIDHINSPSSTIGDGVGWAALAGFAVAFLGYAFLSLGKLSRAEKAARVVYSEYTGRFVDVALLEEGRSSIKQRTREELDRHMVKHATASYREAPQSSWRSIATRPDQRDVPLLRAALTHCRIAWAEAAGPDRSALQRDQQKIFDNLVAASPELLSKAEQQEIR
jgi:hypothetical protein